MKRISMIFFQILIVLIGICAVIFLFGEPHFEGRNINSTLYQIYFNDPFLIYAYIASIPFFTILYQTYKILRATKENKTYSKITTNSVRTLKFCAISIIGFAILGEIFIMLNNSDDRAGGVFMGILVILGAIIIATVATKFERTFPK